MQTAEKQLPKMKDQVKARVVVVTEDLVKKIKTPKYQRTLNTERLPDLMKNVAQGIFIPPITLAEVDGELFVLDGQHRLEARKKMDFELLAVIVPMNEKDATKNFIIANTTQSRVSLKHRLQWDPSQMAEEIRKTAEEFDATPHQVYSLLSGAKHNYYSLMKEGNAFTKKNLEVARQILSVWSRDSRWKTGSKTIFDKQPTLRAVAYLASKSKNPLEAIKKIKTMDFSNNGALARCANSTDSKYHKDKAMREYIMEQIFIKGI